MIQTKPEPFCPLCGARMVLRRPQKDDDWRPFWGCNLWPDCRGKRQIMPDGRPEEDHSWLDGLNLPLAF